MSRAFIRGEVLPNDPSLTVKLGAVSNRYKQQELGKFIKMGTLESQFVLCALGDFIDGYISSVEAATSAGFGIGGVYRDGSKFVTFEGSQAAGTGTIAIGDYVVAGTPLAQGVDQITAYANVRKATVQPGVTIPADFTAVAAHLAMMPFLWKVVSLGTAGTGAVGTTGLIERVCSPD